MVIDPAGRELAFVETGPRHQQDLFDDWKGIPSNVEFGWARMPILSTSPSTRAVADSVKTRGSIRTWRPSSPAD